MKLIVVSTFLISLAFVHGTVRRRDACERAHDECDFKFSNNPDSFVPTIDIWAPPDTAFYRRIVSKRNSEVLGILNSNKIVPEFINADGSITLITSVASPHFRPSHFKPFRIRHTSGSGIGHQTFHGTQKQEARPRCLRVFFSQYQKLIGLHPPYVKKNVFVSRSAFKCVVFRTK